MSGGYRLSPLALADISDIWDYSYSNWGADQADTYVLAIHAACEELTQTLGEGRLGGQIAEHTRGLPQMLSWFARDIFQVPGPR